MANGKARFGKKVGARGRSQAVEPQARVERKTIVLVGIFGVECKFLVVKILIIFRATRTKSNSGPC